MDPEGMRKCMSLGYSTKKANTTIGQCNYNHLLVLFSVGLIRWYIICIIMQVCMCIFKHVIFLLNFCSTSCLWIVFRICFSSAKEKVFMCKT